MLLRVWRTEAADFRQRFEKLLESMSLDQGLVAATGSRRQRPQQVVRRILTDVRERGDVALLEYEEEFDGCTLRPDQLRVSEEDIAAAVSRCPDDYLQALERAAGRIRRFQQAILVRDPQPVVDGGRTLSVRYTPVDSAGLYVPGGVAPLASSVLMTAVPAKVAGVARIAIASPPGPDGRISDDRLAAAHIAGVDEVYRLGGAQAIGALAYGTESVPPVDFIAGPGNIYVTLAKKEVFGHVGIEMLPGPSEVVIIADAAASARYVAADLIAQAEHNPGSAVLLTDAPALAGQVIEELEVQLQSLPRADSARACLQEYGAVIVCRTMDECVELTNELAPEHLQIVANDAAGVATTIRHAGAIFMGAWTPVAVGDYIAGPSHVLPTSTTARFSSGLSANDFLKRSSLISYDLAALAEDAASVICLASAEGLDGHARSVQLRTEKTGR